MHTGREGSSWNEFTSDILKKDGNAGKKNQPFGCYMESHHIKVSNRQAHWSSASTAKGDASLLARSLNEIVLRWLICLPWSVFTEGKQKIKGNPFGFSQTWLWIPVKWSSGSHSPTWAAPSAAAPPEQPGGLLPLIRMQAGQRASLRTALTSISQMIKYTSTPGIIK